MSKKRGLSLEDKREKLLEVFHSSCDVYVLKDVEKLGAKKGVIPQSIKDVLQSLVDDNLVHQEKIGSSNYFWAFPGEASTQMQTEITQLENQIQQLRKKEQQLSQALEKEQLAKQDTKESITAQRQLEGLQDFLKDLQKEVVRHSENDPELFASMKENMEKAKEAANRWLDNIDTLQKWCKKQFPGMETELSQFFQDNGYDENMEYFE
eukprot:TRINITY_DN1170_c0_g1_i1.p6 TRINITY_DN1170_c0_g1~~TRINITY_DN1170_c0_g1_i1.p6  ORF type:complete len:208 (+),score=28.57 TRINITY_DN1170_c0_g1_i1:2013-2636(+)